MAEEIGRNRAGHVSRAPADGGWAVRVVRLPRVDSTNREAERRIAGEIPPEPLMVVAEEQTRGEGRRRASWWSPRGGLWATVAWPLGEGGDAILDGLGLRLGLASLRTVRSLAPAARLKWPNDVLVEGRKVCGCMGRLVSAPGGARWLLAAAGINANNPIDPVLAPRAGSLSELVGRAIDLRALEDRLGAELRWALTTPGLDGAMLAEANEALAGVGAPIRLRDAGERVEGDLLGLGASGTPRVRLGSGGVIEVGPSAETIHDE